LSQTYVKKYVFIESPSSLAAPTQDGAGEHGLIQFRQFVEVALSNGPGVDPLQVR
jgi:hypothetical protein